MRIQLDQAGCEDLQPSVTGKSRCEEGRFQQIALNSVACHGMTRTAAGTAVSRPPARCRHPSPVRIIKRCFTSESKHATWLEARYSFSNRNARVITKVPNSLGTAVHEKHQACYVF